MSILPGLVKAAFTARSVSVATYSESAFSAAFLSSSRTFFFVGEMTYFGLKFFLGSTPSCDFGRSRTCPIDALTMNFESRYFWIVFTFVGDSTTTSDFATARLPPTVRRSRSIVGRRAGGPTRRARDRSGSRLHARRPSPPERSIARCVAPRPASTVAASAPRHCLSTAAPPRSLRRRCHARDDATHPVILARHLSSSLQV